MSDDIKIIDLAEARAKREKPEFSYFVRVDRYSDGMAGEIIDAGDLTAEEFEIISHNLQALSKHFQDKAWEISGDDDHQILAWVRIFASSRVAAFCSNDCSSEEQLEWLDSRLDDAKECVRPGSSENVERILN